MGFFTKFLNRSPTAQTLKMVEMNGSSFYMWNGNVYESDFVCACIRPYVNAIGKLSPKHIQKKGNNIQNSEWPYIRHLLDNPNPFTTGQELQECIAASLKLNNNAFVRVIRDSNGIPCELTYVPATLAEALYSESGELFIRFSLTNGKLITIRYDDLIHIKNMSKDGEIFGQSNAKALNNLLNVLSMTDQSIVKAIKNGGVIRWLLKFMTNLKPSDVKARTNDFVETFMNTKNATGAAGIDNSTEATQIKPNDYIPNASHTEKVIQRLYSFFGTNNNIVQSSYNEDQWNAYYESEIEPVAQKLSNAYTNRLFTDGQQKFQNKIVFGAMSLQYASMSTKLQLLQMVDRGAMTPNEWREILNLAAIDGGDKPIRRLDTAVVKEGGNS